MGDDVRLFVNLPTLPRPIPLPTGAAKEISDDDKDEPEDRSQRKHPDREFSVLVVVLANAVGILVNVGNGHEPAKDQTRQHHAGNPGVEIHQEFL